MFAGRMWQLAILRKFFISTTYLIFGFGSLPLILHGKVPAKNQSASAQRPKLVIQATHDKLLSIAYSSDQKLVLTGGEDRTACLWEVATGREIRRFDDHIGPVYAVAFGPNSNQVLTGSGLANDYGIITVWDMESGKKANGLRGHNDVISQIIPSPDRKHFMTGSRDKVARIWDLTSGKQVAELYGETFLAFSPDGQRICASSEQNRRVTTFDVASGKRIRELGEFPHGISSAAYSPTSQDILLRASDNNWYVCSVNSDQSPRPINEASVATFSPSSDMIAVGKTDGAVALLDAMTLQQKSSFSSHRQAVTDLRFAPNGLKLVSTGSDGLRILWDLAEAREVARFDFSTPFEFSPDSQRFATVQRQTTSVVSDNNGRILHTLSGHRAEVVAVAVAPDGGSILTGGNDREARLWDAQTGVERLRLAGHTTSLRSVEFSPDAQRLLTVEFSFVAHLWDARTGEKISRVDERAEFTKDGGHLISVSRLNNDLSVRETTSGKLVARVGGDVQYVDPKGVVVAGDRIVIAGPHNKAQIWDITTSQPKLLVTAAKADLSADGLSLVGVTNESAVCLWDVRTGEKKYELAKQDRPVSLVAFSPNGNAILTGGGELALKLWTTKTGKLLRTLTGHSGTINRLTFSPDGSRILAGDSWDKAWMWDAESGQLIKNFTKLRSTEWPSFSSRNDYLLTAHEDRLVRVWSVSNGKLLHELDGNLSFDVYRVHFTPDGRLVIADCHGYQGHTVVIWDAATGRQIVRLNGHHGDSSLPVAVSPDCKWFVATSAPSLPVIGRCDTGQIEKSLAGHVGDVISLAFSPSGEQLITGSDDRTAILWNVKTGERIHQLFPPDRDESVQDVAFSETGRRAITRHRHSGVHLWDAQSGNLLKEIRALVPSARFVEAVNHEGDSNTWKIWNVEANHLVNVEHMPEDESDSEAREVFFSPGGQHVAVTTSERSAWLWDATESTVLVRFIRQTPICFSPDGALAFTRDSRGKLRVWQSATGRVVREPLSWAMDAQCIAYSRDGALVLVGKGPTAEVWELGSTTRTHVLAGHSDDVLAVAFSNSEKLAATGSKDGSARVWSLESGEPVSHTDAKKGPVSYVAFSPDDRYILDGGSAGNSVGRVWDAETGKINHESPADNPQSFLIDGTAVLGTAYSSLKFKDANTFKDVNRFTGDALAIRTAMLSPEGDRLLLRAANSDRVVLWRLSDRVRRPSIRVGSESSFAFTTDSLLVLDANRTEDGTSDLYNGKLLNVESGQVIRDFPMLGYSPSLLPGGQIISAYNGCVWNANTGDLLAELPLPIASDSGAVVAALSANGRQAIAWSYNENNGDRVLTIWDLAESKLLLMKRGYIPLGYLPDGTTVAAVGTRDNVVRFFTSSGASAGPDLRGHRQSVNSIVYSPNGKRAATGSSEGIVLIWDLTTGREMHRLGAYNGAATAIGFSPDGRYLWTRDDNSVRLRNWASSTEVARLVVFENGWAVVTPDGVFDIDDLSDSRTLHWVFADEPLSPLPIEVFMRDYYEPQLLRRIIAGETFNPRPASELNRVQPIVRFLGVTPSPGRTDEVVVTVEVEGQTRELSQAGVSSLRDSGAFDFRLFRDGQLVGRMPPLVTVEATNSQTTTTSPDLLGWRAANQIELDADGKATMKFISRLPSRAEPGPVEFTAYAFNGDRVKSQTARTTYQAPSHKPSASPRAYLICMGVSECQTKELNLTFAAADSSIIADAFSRAFRTSKRYEVIPIVLNSERKNETLVELATKANLKAALDLLSGVHVYPAIRHQLPNSEELRAATPDDLVLISFSGHGFTDPAGILHLVPYDVGAGINNVLDARSRCISSNDLDDWLRGIDCGTAVLIVDACHSAAAISAPGFKPGPLGNRGLGQLAYDKGMRVLAASQADDVAIESRKIQQGLLTYALVEEGLNQRLAIKNGDLMLSDLLSFAVDRVPILYQEVIAGKLKGPVSGVAKDVSPIRPKDPQKSRVQRPELFDYSKSELDILLLDLN